MGNNFDVVEFIHKPAEFDDIYWHKKEREKSDTK